MSLATEIRLSKIKLVRLYIATLLFVVTGGLFIINPQGFVSPITKSPEIIRISGIACVMFFGICLAFMTPKLFENKPGLIIDRYGITNNTLGINTGLIEWDDIIRIEKHQVERTKFLILHVREPQKYLPSSPSLLNRDSANIKVLLSELLFLVHAS